MNNKNLIKACTEGNLETVKFIMKSNISVYPDAMLKIAVLNGHLDIIKYLVEDLGADVCTSDGYLICFAINKGYFDITKYLVEHGVDIHTDNEAPACYAAMSGNVDIIKYLVNLGSIINLKWLGLAAGNGNLEMAKYLVEDLNADIHEDSERAMIEAINGGHLEMVKYLYEKGKPFSDEFIDVAMHVSLEACNKDISLFLGKAHFNFIDLYFK